MRSFLVCGFVVLFSVITFAHPASWSRVSHATENHIAKFWALAFTPKEGLETRDCTVILVGDNAHGVTAGHCVARGEHTTMMIRVDDLPAVVVAYEFDPLPENATVRSSWGRDIAYLSFAPLPGKTPIKFCTKERTVGMPVAIIGHGYGLSELSGQFGFISVPYLSTARRIAIDSTALPAESGGPVVGTDGHLIAMLTDYVGTGIASYWALGVPVEIVGDFVKRASKR